jgi:ABC transport system ATP-binding/permease protein
MALLSLLDVSIGFGGPQLLNGINLQVERGERVCLLGRNGAGKSTFMKVIAGDLQPDDGQIFLQRGEQIARLKQEVPEGLFGTVREVGEAGGAMHDWERDIRVDDLIEQAELDPDASFETLSAGLKRRVMLVQGLVDDPALLLLDEPTNHLDIESIAWLETFLLSFKGALLFVTHDRMFLRKLATRIIELDRGILTGWSCDYDTFLLRKEALLEAEAKQQAVFDKKLSQEEAWLRQGVKARRTRNEGRVRALQAMREKRRSRRAATGTVQAQTQEVTTSGHKVIEVDQVSFRFENQRILENFSTLITRGDKIGIVGPNGAGKTTLLQILLGKRQPQQGKVKIGTNLDVAYFDQLREQLDEERTVQDNVADGNETVCINGKTRHVISYLQDFLFMPDRARSPVKTLSGGERNRLLLARLFTRPANFLILDEPTNDLDAETLELLEELLVEYSGTLLLVSHDRAFLNNVATSLLVLEGDGRVVESIGGYDDYVRQRRALGAAPSHASSAQAPTTQAHSTRLRPEKSRKMTHRERQELEQLPGRIEDLEKKQRALAQILGNPSLYQGNNSKAVLDQQEQLLLIERDLNEAITRWEELETLCGQLDPSP